MKKIKLLNGFVIMLLIVYLVNYLGSLYLEFFTDFTKGYKWVSEAFIFGAATQYVGMAISVVTFVGLIYIQKGLSLIIKSNFFNKQSGSKFRSAGYFFLVSSGLSFMFNVLLFSDSQQTTLLTWMSKDFLLFAMGFSMIIIADIISNGNKIQQENDLTI